MYKSLIAALLIAAPNLAFAGGHGIFAQLSGPEAGASGTGEVFNNGDGTVYISIIVNGISLNGLFDDFVAAPVGPIHLHTSNGDGIVLPFPMTEGAYADTDDGFTVQFDALPYADTAALVGSELSVDEFFAEIDRGNIYFNIHTDANPHGGLTGVVGG